MTALATLPGTATVDDVLEVIDRDGGVIVADYLHADVMDEIRRDLLPKGELVPTGADGFSGRSTRRMSAPFAHTRRMVDVVTNPLFLESARRLIDTPIVYGSGDRAIPMRPGIRIGVTQLIQIGPGQRSQPLHRDDWALLWRHHPADRREARLQVMLAVSRFTQANGGTLVVPGSHRWDDERLPEPSEAISCEMAPGSALVFIGSTFHGGGANVTADEWRTGLTVAIDSANVRQEENMYLSLSPEVVASYPEDIQRLLGWQASEVTRMGWVEIDGQMADPIALLPTHR
ncbi:MAG: phytanoyl-CoA dioxygenase family protein [Gammaproteobacteria bacterium]